MEKPGSLIHTSVELMDAMDGLNSGLHLLNCQLGSVLGLPMDLLQAHVDSLSSSKISTGRSRDRDLAFRNHTQTNISPLTFGQGFDNPLDLSSCLGLSRSVLCAKEKSFPFIQGDQYFRIDAVLL